MKRTSLFVDEAQLERIQRLSERSGLSAAEHMRRAVALYLLILDGSGDIAEAVAQAQRTFNDADTPERAVLRALMRWKHDREDNSLRGGQAKQGTQLDRMESKLDKLVERVDDGA